MFMLFKAVPIGTGFLAKMNTSRKLKLLNTPIYKQTSFTFRELHFHVFFSVSNKNSIHET